MCKYHGHMCIHVQNMMFLWSHLWLGGAFTDDTNDDNAGCHTMDNSWLHRLIGINAKWANKSCREDEFTDESMFYCTIPQLRIAMMRNYISRMSKIKNKIPFQENHILTCSVTSGRPKQRTALSVFCFLCIQWLNQWTVRQPSRLTWQFKQEKLRLYNSIKY